MKNKFEIFKKIGFHYCKKDMEKITGQMFMPFMPMPRITPSIGHLNMTNSEPQLVPG